MRQEKHLLLDEIKEQFVPGSSFLIMRYKGLKANDANQLRRDVAKIGGHVKVLKKRMLMKAEDASGVSLDLKALPGHVGLVFTGADPVETTKLIFKFSKESDNSVDVLGGKFDGQLYSAAQVELLSQLPGKDEMRAQFLGTLEAPMSQTLAVIEALLTSVCHCLENKSNEQAGSSS